MKTTSLLLGCLAAATSSLTALALTVNEPVTPAHVRAHPDEWTVQVAQGRDGRIDFTIKHDVGKPMYHVAHLEIHHRGRLIATSDTPCFGRKEGDTFRFSVSAEALAESKFHLSDSAVAGSGDEAVPLPGTIVHQFRLMDFVPEKMLESAPGK